MTINDKNTVSIIQQHLDNNYSFDNSKDKESVVNQVIEYANQQGITISESNMDYLMEDIYFK